MAARYALVAVADWLSNGGQVGEGSWRSGRAGRIGRQAGWGPPWGDVQGEMAGGRMDDN